MKVCSSPTWTGSRLRRRCACRSRSSSCRTSFAVTRPVAAPVFPDVSPEVAAYRVLLVNLDEALTSGGTDITLAYGTVRWTSPPPRSWARPAGSDTVELLEWTAQPPDAWR